jgi:hypothetical protein
MTRGCFSETTRQCLQNVARVVTKDGFDKEDLEEENRMKIGHIVRASFVKRAPKGSAKTYILTSEGKNYIKQQGLNHG